MVMHAPPPNRIRVLDFLQGGPERSDEVVRELPDEPDRVSEQRPVSAVQLHGPGSRIKGSEQAILDEQVGSGKCAQDR